MEGRSEITIDVGALRRNAQTLLRAAGGAELWAVVKANAYGHGARECAAAALDGGATALCVATVPEALELRDVFPDTRVIVLGPAAPVEIAAAREARLALAVADGRIPDGVEVHLKIDTGMGRWGLSELPAPTREVAGVMTHLATADSDVEFARLQLRRFREATDSFAHLVRHAANSAATLRLPESHFDAVRCGIALYGLSPFGDDASADGLEPVLSWRSEIAQTRLLHAGESTGYGRRFVAARDTWIGIVPVGYGDGFRRDLTGTEVVVEDGRRSSVLGTVSMDAIAVELDRDAPPGTPVTIVGDDVPLESHARVAGTITYELSCGIGAAARNRATRVVVGA
ncbi:MAG TPA: alanine racemase [Gaiellaceae bacterium]|nr:alanine racemase [Gaiellaceae bacterium]